MPYANLRSLNPQEVEAYNYNRLIGLVKETNRPPGGAHTLATIAQNAFINSNTKVLEIGTSTGFSAIELALNTNAQIVAIDVNEESLAEARTRAKEFGVSDRIKFQIDDTLNLSSADSSFDVVLCGNVTSIVLDAEKALSEYLRVLKVGGLLASVPMYYLTAPSPDLIAEVSMAIGVDITPKFKRDWIEFFASDELHLIYSEDYAFDELSSEGVDAFVREILKRPHLSELRRETSDALALQYRKYMQLFRRNLAQMGFTVMLMRKSLKWLDRELFTSHRI